jgi:hypothetical protein
LINKTKFTQYCVPPAHAPASVLERISFESEFAYVTLLSNLKFKLLNKQHKDE